MRHRQAIALAAVALVGLTGCDGPDPNNLETYYDDPVPTSSAVPRASDAPVSPAKAAPVTPPPAVPDAGRLAERALLSDADVAEEGVRPASNEVAGCLADGPSAASRTATWRYSGGSVLSHRVVAFDDRSAAHALADDECAGKTVSVPVQPGVELQRARCDGKTCTVLLAKGRLVSELTVSASTEARAVDAAKRLLPAMTAKLTAQP
ncbi:hypothetical protein [Amycolatopsis australiensis]|uniref:DUF3558 domain-containing protein n=1 Tax=Amycolatopsis australiensis TaxID=546364 RepID=A0A1K1SCM8_9PSEU|nr:hypothetical protein [Amycolatopsis australiensis]SFW82120.1 hypothetical protein SAMN04489730_5336 [Amycolatopsis australiensis]